MYFVIDVENCMELVNFNKTFLCSTQSAMLQAIQLMTSSPMNTALPFVSSDNGI